MLPNVAGLTLHDATTPTGMQSAGGSGSGSGGGDGDGWKRKKTGKERADKAATTFKDRAAKDPEWLAFSSLFADRVARLEKQLDASTFNDEVEQLLLDMAMWFTPARIPFLQRLARGANEFRQPFMKMYNRLMVLCYQAGHTAGYDLINKTINKLILVAPSARTGSDSNGVVASAVREVGRIVARIQEQRDAKAAAVAAAAAAAAASPQIDLVYTDEEESDIDSDATELDPIPPQGDPFPLSDGEDDE